MTRSDQSTVSEKRADRSVVSNESSPFGEMVVGAASTVTATGAALSRGMSWVERTKPVIESSSRPATSYTPTPSGAVQLGRETSFRRVPSASAPATEPVSSASSSAPSAPHRGAARHDERGRVDAGVGDHAGDFACGQRRLQDERAVEALVGESGSMYTVRPALRVDAKLNSLPL